MNLVDIIILLLFVMGAIVGFKKGFFTEIVSFIGTILITCASFILKNTISVIFYENLPFFNFSGIFKGLQILNVVFYEILAFLVVFGVLYIALNIIIKVTGLVEKLLKLTIFLAIPSKILGLVLGIVEVYFYTFIILYILHLPIVNINMVNESKYGNYILNNTPVLSKYADKTLTVYNSISNIINNKGGKSTNEINRECLELMLDNDAISVESVNKLIEKNKIEVDNSDFISKYEVND